MKDKEKKDKWKKKIKLNKINFQIIKYNNIFLYYNIYNKKIINIINLFF